MSAWKRQRSGGGRLTDWLRRALTVTVGSAVQSHEESGAGSKREHTKRAVQPTSFSWSSFPSSVVPAESDLDTVYLGPGKNVANPSSAVWKECFVHSYFNILFCLRYFVKKCKRKWEFG